MCLDVRMRATSFQLCKEEHRRGRYLKLTLLRIDFIRLSLVTCLLLAGCARDDLIGHGMIVESEILQLPSRFVLLLLASSSHYSSVGQTNFRKSNAGYRSNSRGY